MKCFYLMNQSLLKDKEERRLLNKKLPYNILKWSYWIYRDYLIQNATNLITVGLLKTFFNKQRNLRKLSKAGVRHLLKN